MKKLPIALILCAAAFAIAHSAAVASDFERDVALALSDDPKTCREGTVRLRAGGPEAFEKLLAYREKQTGPSIDRDRLNDVIDQVGGARYSSVSGLYWHTDWEQAKGEAKEHNKPILSLRMMGRLTDEYSCANSRFFRTTLYANAEISKYLKDHYVLYWKSVRPVPKVTIDFGDGRRLERTLTGNSIHYILTSDGLLVDGLPGLYSPALFLAWLKELQPTAVAYSRSNIPPDQLRANLAFWHTQKASTISRQWRQELDAVTGLAKAEELANNKNAANQENPPAAQAALRTMPKAALELPIIANVVKDNRALELETLGEAWERMAERHRQEVKLDRQSVELIRSENPIIPGSAQGESEAGLARLIASFEKAIALDSVRNEYLLHTKLHEWLAEANPPLDDVEKLNEKVYAELFLTPRQDPWIGLVPPDTYTGLTNGGAVLPE